jgi:hypothetical protein
MFTEFRHQKPRHLRQRTSHWAQLESRVDEFWTLQNGGISKAPPEPGIAGIGTEILRTSRNWMELELSSAFLQLAIETHGGGKTGKPVK